LPHSLRHLLALSPTPAFLVSTVPGLWHRSSPGHYTILTNPMPFKLRYPSKAHQEYKDSYDLAYPTVQHVSSNMQSSPHDTSRNYPYQRHHQNSLSSTHSPNYLDPSGQPVGYHPVMQSPQVQRSTYGHPQDHQAMLAGHPAASPSLSITQQSGPSMSAPYSPQHYASDANHAGVLLNPGVPPHLQYYRPIEHGQPIVPSQQHHTHSTPPQKPYPNPANQTQGGHPQYSNPTNNSSASVGYGSASPPSSSSPSSPHACGVCGATFTRPHDRKRHYESQHTTIEHVCQYCRKSYARVDSLKRHLDRPCDKMPQSVQKGT